MVSLLSFCASFQCCRRKVKKEELEEPYGVINISDRSSISDRVASHVSFRLPNTNGAFNGERFSQPNLSQSSTRCQHSLQRSSVPPSQPHYSTRRALPKLPALEGSTSNVMYSSIERQSSSKRRPQSPPYIEEGVNPTYESIDAESDSISDPLYSKLESENANGRKYDYPIFNRIRTGRVTSTEEAVYQSASQIYAAASEDPYSSITSQRGGETSADPGYALVKENIGKGSSENDTAANVRPSTSHNAEDLYTKIQRGATSDSGSASKKSRQDGQSLSLPGVSYTSESNQQDDYITSDGEKTSREPSYRYITVRESVDVIRRRLDERGVDGGTRSAVGSADGSLPLREHYYSSIGGGSDYESVSVGALYERIPDLAAENAENELRALPEKTTDSLAQSVNAFGQMPSTSTSVTIVPANDTDKSIPPKPPTSPIPNRLSGDAPRLISPIRYSTDRKEMSLVENSPPYASVRNDRHHTSDNATIQSISSGVPKVIVENSSGKNDVKKQLRSSFFSINLDETNSSLHSNIIVPPEKQSNSSHFNILERKMSSELHATAPGGFVREVDLRTTADIVKDGRSTRSSTDEARNVAFVGRSDRHRTVGEISTKTNNNEYFAGAKGGSRGSTTADDRCVWRSGISTSNDPILRNAHFMSETFVLPSAPYRTANRSPENVIESESMEFAQERSSQGTSFKRASEAPVSTTLSAQDSSDLHVDVLPAEMILEKTNQEEKEQTIDVERTSYKESETIEETRLDTAEYIVPIELIPSNSTAFVSELHMRPSQSGSFTDRSSQPTFRSEVETYITVPASVSRSLPIEIGTKSTDTSDIESGLMNRSFDSTGSQTDDLHVSDNRVGRSSSKSTIPVLRNSQLIRRKSSELKERRYEEGSECDEPIDEINAPESRQTPRSTHSLTGNALPNVGNLTGRDYVSPVDLGTERSWPLVTSCEEDSSVGSSRSKVFSNSIMAPPNPEAIFQPLSPGVKSTTKDRMNSLCL